MEMEINTSHGATVQPSICLQRHLNKWKLRKTMQVPLVYPGSKLREVKLTTDEAWSNGNFVWCLVLSFPSRPHKGSRGRPPSEIAKLTQITW